MKDMDLIKANYVENVRNMYRELKRYSEATEAEEEHRCLFWAAYYADCMITGAEVFGRNDGGRSVKLNEDGARVTLKQAEETAYGLLVKRASAAPTNAFYDNGKRWFW